MSDDVLWSLGEDRIDAGFLSGDIYIYDDGELVGVYGGAGAAMIEQAFVDYRKRNALLRLELDEAMRGGALDE